MVRFVALALAFTSLLAGSQIYAAPANEIAARQIGNLQCNLDRLSIVAGLAATQGTLKKLTTALANDTNAADGIKSVTDSVSNAQGAIGVIGKALITGQKAPAEARDQVQGNLTAAHDALSGINSTDTSVASTLAKALTQLTNAQLAGDGVVNNCK